MDLKRENIVPQARPETARPPVRKENLDNMDIATVALYRLGGSERHIDTEDVALECYAIAPKRFSWKKYPEYPESEPARSALFDARKTKNGSLVRGDNRKGWLLTTAGVDHVRHLLANGLLLGVPSEAKSDRQETQRYFNRVEKHPAFQKFQATGDCDGVERHEFTDFLRCPLDVTPEVLRERLEIMKSRAHDANRGQLLEFLACCEKRFATLLAG